MRKLSLVSRTVIKIFRSQYDKVKSIGGKMIEA